MTLDVSERKKMILALLRRRQKARGVTLLEVLIVVAIIAMVAGGVAFFALPRFKEAQIKTAETGARVIRQATQSWQASNNESNCPTISQLVQDKQLDPGANTTDPWGQPYVINCADGDVSVTSTGPDKKKGTKDDIHVPKSSATPEAGAGE
ncbi:MAG: type II secretion system protein [Myxococcales bacterium]|nr:type II secretion system protein [Myxococcales bacterium]